MPPRHPASCPVLVVEEVTGKETQATTHSARPRKNSSKVERHRAKAEPGAFPTLEARSAVFTIRVDKYMVISDSRGSLICMDIPSKWPSKLSHHNLFIFMTVWRDPLDVYIGNCGAPSWRKCRPDPDKASSSYLILIAERVLPLWLSAISSMIEEAQGR